MIRSETKVAVETMAGEGAMEIEPVVIPPSAEEIAIADDDE
jgi:hypothetical protein